MRPQIKYRDPAELGLLQLKLDQRGRCSLAAAAKLLHVHPQTIVHHAKQGTIRTVKIGQRLFVLKEELERYQVEGPLTTPMPKGLSQDELT